MRDQLHVRPCTLKEANALVAQLHRLSIAAYCGERCVGVAIVGRPVARMVDQYRVAEVTRLATDGTKNACSILYAAAARACDAMGFESIQTYTLPEEGGASLRAAGWTNEGFAGGGDWNRGGESTHKNRRTDQPMSIKTRWRKRLTASHTGRTKEAPHGGE